MDYPTLPSLTLDGTIYTNENLGYFEALIPPGKWASAHAPTLLETPNGDLLCAWFAGSFEGRTDISIVCSRLPKNASKWTTPVQVSNDAERSEQNPSLFLASNDEVWMVYTAQLGRTPGKDNMQFTSIIKRQRSFDFGQTWGEPEILFDQEGSFCRQPIQKLSGGRWIFGNWMCADGEGLGSDRTVLQLSDDQGLTWRSVEMPDSIGRVHANIVELIPGHLVAFMRSRAADFIYRSDSTDHGESWSVPYATPLPNNNSSISVIKLQSGRIAVAYNPTHAPDARLGVVAWPGLRCPVAVALSEDDGKTWPLIRNVELGEGYIGNENSTNNRQYEYPYLMQTRDGMLHLAYAYKNRLGVKWVSFNEEDIVGKKRETIGLYNPTSAKI